MTNATVCCEHPAWVDSTRFCETGRCTCLLYSFVVCFLQSQPVSCHVTRLSLLFPGEREWNSPLTERQRDEQKSGYDAPRRYPVDARQSDPRRPEIALPHGTVVHRNCPSPGSVDQPVPRFERERLSPIHQKDSTEMSPIPRFESPNSEHSDDAPLSLDAPAPHPHLPPKSILKRGGPLSAVRQHSNSPGHTPPHEPGPPLQRFDGPDPMVPPRPHPPGWYEDGPHLQGPGRFDGGRPPLHNVLERFDGPDGPHMPHGLVRGGDGMGRFDGHPPPQGPGRFEGPMGQQPPVRFANQGPGPSHFDPQHCFENSLAPGPGPLGFQQQRPVRFDGPPNQLGPMRFEGPSRFDGPAPRFDSHFEGQQGPPRFPPQHNMQPPMRPMGQPVYDNQMVPQQNFNMGPQRFPEPMNPTFPTGPMTFPAQPSLQQGNFNMQPAAAFNQSGPVPFYNTAAPSVGMQQPVSDSAVNQTLSLLSLLWLYFQYNNISMGTKKVRSRDQQTVNNDSVSPLNLSI